MKKIKYLIIEGYGGAGFSMTPMHRVQRSGSYGSGGGTFMNGMYSYSIVPLNKALEQKPIVNTFNYNIGIGSYVKAKTEILDNRKSEYIEGFIKRIEKNTNGDIKNVFVQNSKTQEIEKVIPITISAIIHHPNRTYHNIPEVPSRRRIVKESYNETKLTWGQLKDINKIPNINDIYQFFIRLTQKDNVKKEFIYHIQNIINSKPGNEIPNDIEDEIIKGLLEKFENNELLNL